jgi:O-antigen/teichoic acid export membrane protein
MSLIRKNIIANFAGSIWVSFIGLMFIPIYIKFLGVESWGLIGIFATLQAVLSVLDMGFSGTLNREMARLSGLPNKEQEMYNLIRTLELIYWIVAFFAAVSVVLLSSYIAYDWIDRGKLSGKTVEQCLLFMAFVIALQMPAGFYSGGLMGLQKHVLLNVINIFIGTLRSVGAVLILWLVSPTIQAFFLWQIVISVTNTFLLAFFLRRKLPVGGKRGVFQMKLLKGVWKFSAGMSGITVFATILTQLDKAILSKILSLEMFGYYSLASIVAMSLSRLFTPIFVSIYPRFTQLVAINDQHGLKQLYHTSCQFMSVLILPVAFVIALFSYEIILLWTQNPETAKRTHLLVSILICGTAINGLMNLPYALQLAFGWTKLSFFKTLIAAILLVPLIVYMTTRYGATGAAIAWVILNLGMFFFEIPIMHKRLLKTEKWRWYLEDICLPLAPVLVIGGLARLLINGPIPHFIMFLYLLVILIITFALASITAPATRSWIMGKLVLLNWVKAG